MRVPLSWLREFVAWDEGAEELASALTARGVAVESIDRPGVGAAGIVAARIESVETHPVAGRLRICRVRAGTRTGRVVCGAPNAAPGMLAAWAPPGAVLPGGKTLGIREFSEIPSEGMLCSPEELGLPGGRGGLLELPGEGASDGDDLVGALCLDDPVLVLELTPNYAAHCQSILGVAREVAAWTRGTAHRPGAEPAEDGQRTSAAAAAVHIEVPGLCPLYVARIMEGLRHGPAPLRIAHRLAQCGMRPIGGVVDVTNYVMLELGHPLHAFDLHRLVDGLVMARRAGAGEKIVTFDGHDRTLQASDLVIADGRGPVAIAGVMGGERARVTPETTAILLESAIFDAPSVAQTARRLNLPSEAAARFARGVDPGMARPAADRAAQLLQETCGATVLAGAIHAGPGVASRFITLRGRRARGLLGIRLSTADCGRHLARLGFRIQADGADRLRVTVPGWRPDVAEEVDLIEEIGRSVGYDNLPLDLPSGDPGVELPDPVKTAQDTARSVTLGAGYTEVQPYSYHGVEVWDRLRLSPAHPWRQAVAVTNPISRDQALLRTSLLPGLLQTLALNARRSRVDAAVFEIGRVFLRSPDGGRPQEPRRLGVAGYGALQPGTWNQPADPCDFFAIKGLFEEILARLGIGPDTIRWERAADRWPLLHPGRCAAATVGGTLLGWLGETHPEVTAAFDLPGPAALGELELGAVAGLRIRTPKRRTLPRFPAARRDLAVLMARDFPAADVLALIRETAGELLAEARPFDVYTGPELPEGWRSVAFALTYQADRTLTDAEVESAHTRIRTAISRHPGLALRS